MASGPVHRGDIWLTDFGRPVGHEQGGRRPALVISMDRFNRAANQLLVALPLTTKSRSFHLHVPLEPPEGGVFRPSHIKCEDIRCISAQRLIQYMGHVGPEIMTQVEERLGYLLGL